MKTLTDVKKEIDRLIQEGNSRYSHEKRRLSKIKSRINGCEWLNRIYLPTVIRITSSNLFL